MIAALWQVKTRRAMIANREPSIADGITAALAWWREAGVENDFADAAQSWLADPEEAQPPPLPEAVASMPRTPAPVEAPVERLGGLDAMPGDLAAFTAWWLSEPSLDHGRVEGRVAPRGAAGATLMVIVAEPEPGDSQFLLSGPQGRMLDAMLAAMGIAPEMAYIASALPRHTPAADWAGLAAAGLGDVLRRHIKLAAPQRILALGGNILPLLGHDPTLSAEILPQFNHEGFSAALLPAPDLASLLARPRARAGFWQRWLDWSSKG